MSNTFRSVVECEASPDVLVDPTGEAGYIVKVKVDDEEVSFPKLDPKMNPVRFEISAPASSRVNGLVFAVNSQGMFSQGRPFHFTQKPAKPPRPVGEVLISKVFPSLPIMENS